MTTPNIILKLEAELDTGIKTEAQVVYLLVQIRKLIERDRPEKQFEKLKFYCDWALHSSMDRAAAKAILKQFDAAYALLNAKAKLKDLPEPLQSDIKQISLMRSFEEELTTLLLSYHLPPLTQHRSDGWTQFLHLYGKVIEDIPLKVSVSDARRQPKQATQGSGPKHISHVIVSCETARETIKHADGEEVLFKLTWTIYDKKNGNAGEICVFNTFTDRKT